MTVEIIPKWGRRWEMTLDLHGVRHADVKDLVEDFVLKNQEDMPLEIIYGNSTTMYTIVSQCLEELNVNYHSGYRNQYGRLLVLSWKDSIRS